MIVDREHREQLADAIERFLADGMTAFEFDDEIQAIREASDDATIRHVCCALWFHYDDCKDHQVILSKLGWDYFYRLMLLLKSNAQLRVELRRQWSLTQLVALIAIVLFVCCAVPMGFGKQLFVVSIPFGVVSIGLSKYRERVAPSGSEIALIPFASISEIARVRREVVEFRKRKYPPDLATRVIRTPLESLATWLPMYAVWLTCAPIVLLFQMLPVTVSRTYVDAC
ncbi:MAG: hypothetical protein EXS05_00060 [Planctomycetaceae bacterium]|nr:hypothetical protein [Planctomycetaceae bacterium]